MVVSMQDEASLTVIGKIVGVYGIKGWIKILSFTRPKENILKYGPWLVKQNNDFKYHQYHVYDRHRHFLPDV